MANDYATLAEVKAYLPDSGLGSTTAYDATLTAIISAVSRKIDRHTRRDEGAYAVGTETTRYFNGSDGIELQIDELAVVPPSSVKVAESGVIDGAGGTGGTYTTWATTDYLVEPYNAIAQGRPATRLVVDQLNGTKTSWYSYRKAVKITGYWGYATTAGTPDPIKQATIIQTVRIYKRSQQGFTDAGAIVELGQIRYVKDLDPDVAGDLENYIRTGI